MTLSPPPPGTVPVEVDGATKVYPGGVRALDGARFAIAAGERACLLGPNGAGKTTLIRLVTGMLRPTAGTVRLFGRTSDDPGFLAAKRRVGIVPQAPGMYRDLRAGEYLALVARLYQRGSVDRVVSSFGLGPYLARPMAQLSTGWQRRLVLAAAVLPEPELLLLDEPTVGLDPIASREVLASLRAAMAGRTTLLCTHNLAEAEALCDTAVILRAGRVLLHASIAALRARAPQQVVLAAQQGPGAILAALAAAVAAGATVRDDAVYLPVADPAREAPALLRRLLAAGVEVHECRAHAPRLEDLFVQIVADETEGRDAARRA